MIETIVPYLIFAAIIGFGISALDYFLIEEKKITQIYKHIKFWTGISLSTLAIFKLPYSFWASFFLVLSMAMAYWITFERLLNYWRQRPAFYIGVNSNIDNFLRLLWGERGGYYAYLLKLVIGFVSVCLFTYLINQ